MFRRIILFDWTDEATEEQRKAVETQLAQLPSLIPEIRRFEIGHDAGVDGNADFGVVADFDSVADWRAYVAHPAHQKAVVEYLRPIMAGIRAVQYEF